MLTRKEINEFMKSHADMAAAVKECEGRNYTQVASSILMEYIDEYMANLAPVATVNDIDIIGPMNRLIEVLRNKKIIIKSEYEYIIGTNVVI